MDEAELETYDNYNPMADDYASNFNSYNCDYSSPDIFQHRGNAVPTLFVSHIPLEMDDKVFRELFETCGEVERSFLYTKANTTYKVGKITFANKATIHKAVSKFHQKPPYDMRITLDKFQPKVSSHSSKASVHKLPISMPRTSPEEFDRHNNNTRGNVDLNKRLSSTENSSVQSQHECSVCSKPTTFKCSECPTFYCTTNCQVADWNDHKESCRNNKKAFVNATTSDSIQRNGARPRSRRPVVVADVRRNRSRSLSSTRSRESQNVVDHKVIGAPLYKQERFGRHPMKQQIIDHGSTRSFAKSLIPSKSEKTLPNNQMMENGSKSSLSETDNKTLPDKACEVCVTFMIDPHNFYVRLSGMDEITSAIQNLPPNRSSLLVKVNDVIAAKFREDNKWYRAKVLNINNDGSCTVYFIDYGNIGQVIMREILKLPADIAVLPGQAFRCRIAEVEPSDGHQWSMEEVDMFEEFIESNKLVAKKRKCINGINWINLTNDGCVDFITLFEERFCSSRDCMTELPINKHSTDYWNCDDRLSVLVTINEDLGSTWILDNYEIVLEKLSCLTEECQRMPPTSLEFSPGSVVAARESSNDRLWYRAAVLEVHKNGWYVQYLDFGNCEAVTELQPLPDKYMTFPAACVKLVGLAYPDKFHKFVEGDVLKLRVVEKGNRLVGVSITNDPEHLYCAISVWHEIKRRLANVTETSVSKSTNIQKVRLEPKAKFTSADNAASAEHAKAVVNLEMSPLKSKVINGSHNVNEVIAQMKELLNTSSSSQSEIRARDLSFVKLPGLNEKVLVYILASSTTEIYPQIITSESEELTKNMVRYLEECENSKSLDKLPMVSEIRCAKSKEYNSWYRCEILNVNSKDSIEVRYIDFGNTETVSLNDIVKIPNEIRNVSKLAVPVVLADVKLTKSVSDFIIQQCEWEMSIVDSKTDPITVILSKSDGALLKDMIKTSTVKALSNMENQSSEKKEYSPARSQQVQNKEPSPAKFQQVQNKELSPAKCQQFQSKEPSPVKSQQKPLVNSTSAQASIKTDTPSNLNSSTEGVKSDSKTVDNLQVIMYDDAEFVKMSTDGATAKVIFVVVTAPIHMFCWFGDPEEISRQLIDLSQTIGSAMESKKCSYLPELGEMCVAKYESDDLWYRATCLSSEKDSCELLFVDYGNVEIVKIDHIGKMQNDFMKIPIQGLLCVLNGVEDGDMPMSGAYEKFKELVPCEEPFNIKVIKSTGTYYVIEIPSIEEPLRKLGMI